MLLLALLLILNAFSARLIADLWMEDADLADRVVLCFVIFLTITLAVPIYTGYATGLMTPLAYGSGFALVLTVAAGLLAWKRRGEVNGLHLVAFRQPLLRALWRETLYAPRPVQVLWGVVTLLLVALLLPAWLLPFRNADAVGYHIYQPLKWWQTGEAIFRLRYPNDLASPWMYAENYTNLKAPFVLMTLQARGDFRLSGAVAWMFLVLWVLVLWAMSRQWSLPRWTAPLIVLAVATMPEVMFQATDLYADLQSAASLSVALWGLSGMALAERWRRWIPAAALGMGLLAASKTAVLPAGAVAGLAGLVIAWRRAEGGAKTRGVLTMLGCGIAAGLVLAGPWMIRAWIVYGNPIYPFEVAVGERVLFPGSGTPGINKQMMRDSMGIGPAEAFLRAPFETLGVTHFANRLSGYGPAWIVLLVPSVVAAVLAWVLRCEHRAGIAALLFVAFLLAIPDSWWPRYAMLAITPAALLFGWLLARSGRWPRIYLIAVLAIGATWNVYRVVPATTGWPRTPITLAYPFVTGDVEPLAIGREPVEYTARRYARDIVLSDPGNWLGVVTNQTPHFTLVEPGRPNRLVTLPNLPPGVPRDGWLDAIRPSRATHLILFDRSQEEYAVRREPARYDLLYEDPPPPYSLPDHGGRGSVEQIWVVTEPGPEAAP